MSKALPNLDSEIKAEFSDSANYFSLMLEVARCKNTGYQKAYCNYARKVMLVLGYPGVTATWSDDQTINYAQNIVAMG
jgi:hypothetical protein